MQSAFPPSSDAPFDASIGAVLKSLLDSHGLPLLGNVGQLKGLLSVQYPQAKREVSILAQALEAGIPQALLSRHAGEAPMAQALRLAQQLSQDTAMAPAAAQWAVHTWQQGVSMAPVAGTPGALAVVAPLASLPAAPVYAAAPPALHAAPVPLAGIPPAVKRNPKVLAASAAGVLAVAGAGAWFAFGQSQLAVTQVRGNQSYLIGDGKPQPVTLAFAAKNTEIQAVDVRFVRGDGNWTPPNWTVNADNQGKAAGNLPAGSLSYRANGSMNSTFEYTLVSKDGKRSTPFEHTFNIVPPVLITSARLPAAPRLNQPYSVQLAYKKGAGDIVQVTRRVVDSSVPWAQPEETVPVQLNQATGSYDFRLEPPAQPMRSTVEFEMVDALGVKSEPVRVAVNVAVQPITSGPATVLNVVLVSGNGQAAGAGAVLGAGAGLALGNKIGRGSGNAVATVLGGVAGAFAGHQLENKVRGPSVWETTVRFDDGNTRRIRHADRPRWNPGERVTVSGGAILR